MKVGYARVSTKGQSESLETQRGALEAAGCARVFEDVLSGAKASRPGLRAALDYMRDDDVLVVTRLDRLGRTALDTLRTIEKLAQQNAQIVATVGALRIGAQRLAWACGALGLCVIGLGVYLFSR